MKVLACYSKSHIPFLSHHFLPTLPLNMHAELVHIEQSCRTGVYTDPTWGGMAARTLTIKGAVIAGECHEDGGYPIFVSDVDARFFDPLLAKDLEGLWEASEADLLMQDDGAGGLCSGSFLASPSPRLANIFHEAAALVPEFGGHDQPALGEALKRHPEIKVEKLPPRYWSHGASTGKLWEPGQPLPATPPADLAIHQANWCIGIENKLALLDAVAKLMELQRAAERAR